ncbi:hypothetical protein HPB50_018454 [Hyalomma asiaticum]|uniref:Uncharacterized protein n=1 Tax=Hyalomma asiaticum TaxID=266040 RepID=A0ACB7S7G7_HYAAI|nr:hypothetical protein HPB50_018454 [Hyalomma asiaticum]
MGAPQHLCFEAESRRRREGSPKSRGLAKTAEDHQGTFCALPTPSRAVPWIVSAQLTLSLGAGVLDRDRVGPRLRVLLLWDRDRPCDRDLERGLVGWRGG